MGPMMGDTRTYLSDEVVCSFLGVFGTMSKPYSSSSPDVDAWAQLQVIIGSLARGGV